MPVIPGRVCRGIACVDPGAVLNMHYIVIRDRMIFQVFINSFACHISISISHIAGIRPGAPISCAAGRVVPIMSNHKVLCATEAGSISFMLSDNCGSNTSLVPFLPGACLFNRDAGNFAHLTCFRIYVLHPVRNGSKRELIMGHLLLVKHRDRDPLADITGILQIRAIGR